MAMYHSWDAQNAWLRQIIADNALYINVATAAKLGLADGDWVCVESHHAKLNCRIRAMEGVEPNTVWTWNAIGKQAGAWGLAPDAPEATCGFLLNHLIAEHLPAVPGNSQRRITNSDPVTGQAAWFDLRVRITKCTGAAGPHPTFEALPDNGTPRPAVLRWC
jgi:anaerobic selenocysteine-containing dehydrogenase